MWIAYQQITNCFDTPHFVENIHCQKKNEWNTVVFTKQNLGFLPFSNIIT